MRRSPGTGIITATLLRLCCCMLCCLAFLPISAADESMPPTWCLTAASRWPSVVTGPSQTTSEAMQNRFAHLLRYTLNPTWLPATLDKVPYQLQWGFVLTREASRYRLHAREIMYPVYDGARDLYDGLIVRVDPLSGKIAIPATKKQMVTLLRPLLSTDVLHSDDAPGYAPAIFRVTNGVAYYAQANYMYAWTDGKSLRIAYYEEPISRYPDGISAHLSGVRNPWLRLASTPWPTAIRKSTPPAGAAEHFALWTYGTMLSTWVPSSLSALPYDKTHGFLVEKTTAQYRVRIREASLPSTRPWNAILVAVTPVKGNIPLPADERAMRTLLGKFLSPSVLAMPALDQCPAEFVRNEHSWQYTKYHNEQTVDIPLNLFAWSDGKRLLIALQEDVPSDCPTCTF